MKTLLTTLLIFSIFTGFAEARTRAELVGLVRNKQAMSTQDINSWYTELRKAASGRCGLRIVGGYTPENLFQKLNDALSRSC